MLRPSRLMVRLGLLLALALGARDPGRAQPTNALAPLAPALQYPTNEALLPGKGPVQSWKPFPRLWAMRRAQFLHQRQQDQGAVVFLGDSITQGWNGLAQAFPDLKVANRGIGGDTTRGVWYRLRGDVLDLDPAAVVLLIGTNDLGNGGDPDDAADNILGILAALKRFNPKMPVILCLVMPSKAGVADEIRKLNARLEQGVKGNMQVILCDTWSIYATPDGTCQHDEFPDMLHPNKAGYEKWAAALKPIFARLHLASAKTAPQN
jgi:lysophospholipase L1-like esterase